MTSKSPQVSTPIKVAVVGFGVMGKRHANVYATLPYTKLVAIVDPLKSQRNLAATNYAIDTYSHIDCMLRNTELDAVSIVAPTNLHFSLVKCCLEANLHVMVEKPVATNCNHARELINLSQKHDLILQVGHITRFYKAVQMLKGYVKEPYFIEARRLVPSYRVRDVGVILDLMIHDIDIVLGLVPNSICEINVVGQRLREIPYEDIALAQIVFENGCIARFLANRVAHQTERSLVVAESGQTLQLDFSRSPNTELTLYNLSGSISNNQAQVIHTYIEEDNPLRAELEHFLARILHKTTPIGTLEDDLKALDLASKLTKKLHSKFKVVNSWSK